MNFISALVSKARKDMHLRITLINGETLEGDIVDINEESVIVIRNDEASSLPLLSGISLKMIGVWQLSLSDKDKTFHLFSHKKISISSEKGEKRSQDAEKQEDEPDDEDEIEVEELLKDEIGAFLSGFTPYDVILSEIEPNKQISTLPNVFREEKTNTKQKIWDSILKRYQDAEKINNHEAMEYLSEEMLSLGSKFPDSGIFYYNAACFKLKCYNYPDAGQLFEKAFKLDKKSEYLYNAAFAYLHEENRPQALVSFGIYFCIENPLSDIKMWYKFCDIVRETEDYYVFKNTLHEALIKFYSSEEESTDLLKLMLQSIVYVFRDVKTLHQKIGKLIQKIKSNDLDSGSVRSSAQFNFYLHFIDELSEEPGLCNINSSFDQIAVLLGYKKEERSSDLSSELDFEPKLGSESESESESESKHELKSEPKLKSESKSKPKSESESKPTSGPESKSEPATFRFANKKSSGLPSRDEDGILFSEQYSTDLKYGYIYRTIPPGKYGFLRDGKGTEHYFKYEDVLGNAGYIDSASEDNQFPVLFMSRASPMEDVATPNTAYIVISPELLENILDLAKQFAKERDYPHAILELKTVLDYDPENSEARSLKERWEKLYEEKYRPGSEINKINFKPKNEAEWRNTADFILRLGMYEEAIDAFNHAKSGMSSSFCGQGIAYLKTGRYSEAVEYFNRALEKNVLYCHARYARGVAYQRQGMYEHALEDFNEVLKFRPDYQDAWKQKAFVLDQLKKYEDSIAAYDMSLALVPWDWTTLSKKSSVLTKENKLSKAMECVEEALSHIPDHSDSLFTKGYIFQKEGKLDCALEWIEKSLEYDPGNIKALTKKAYILAKLGNCCAAADEIEKALTLNPNNPKTWYYRGVVFHYAENYEEAIYSYQRSLELKPGIKRVISCKERAEEKMTPPSQEQFKYNLKNFCQKE